MATVWPFPRAFLESHTWTEKRQSLAPPLTDLASTFGTNGLFHDHIKFDSGRGKINFYHQVI